MELTRREMASTNAMDSMAPMNAAAMSAQEPSTRPWPIPTIITMATTSLAPDEIPKMYGPAMGLLKNVCSRKPESARPPPSTVAAIMRGRRICQTTLYSTVKSLPVLCPPLNRIDARSSTGIAMLPMQMFKTRRTSKSAMSAANTTITRKRRLFCAFESGAGV